MQDGRNVALNQQMIVLCTSLFRYPLFCHPKGSTQSEERCRGKYLYSRGKM